MEDLQIDFSLREELNKKGMSKTMFELKTDIAVLDEENASLLEASKILESLGNYPGLTANTFYAALLARDVPVLDHERLSLAAIAIETMMSIADEDLKTIH
jgi:hypothetical protein